MGRKLRTFVAIEVEEEVRAAAASVFERLSMTGTKLRGVGSGAMHLTVKFIGDWEENLLGDLCSAVSRAAARVEPFEIRFAGVGAFPDPRRARVVFLGCESDPPGAFAALHRAIEDELEPLGIPRENRAFHPHLTLARVKGPPSAALAEAIGRFADFEAGEGAADEVAVFLSELTREGPIYTRAGTAPFSAVGA